MLLFMVVIAFSTSRLHSLAQILQSLFSQTVISGGREGWYRQGRGRYVWALAGSFLEPWKIWIFQNLFCKHSWCAWEKCLVFRNMCDINLKLEKVNFYKARVALIRVVAMLGACWVVLPGAIFMCLCWVVPRRTTCKCLAVMVDKVSNT